MWKVHQLYLIFWWVPSSHKTPFDYSTHKSIPNLRPKPTSTHQHTMHDGWMDGWMGVWTRSTFSLYSIHILTIQMHLPTYLPTYLVATRVRWVLEIAPNPPPPPGIKVDNRGYEKKSNTQFLSRTMGLKKSNTQLLYNWSSHFFCFEKKNSNICLQIPILCQFFHETWWFLEGFEIPGPDGYHKNQIPTPTHG